MQKRKTNRKNIPVRHLKGCDSLNLKKFANKLALCNRTDYANIFLRHEGNLENPALSASLYDNADTFRHDYLLYNLLRKYNGSDSLVPASKRSSAAFEKFCHIDQRLVGLNSTLDWSFLALNEPVAHTILYRAARKIERLLGVLSIAELVDYMSFSHGATMLHKRTEGRAPYKFSFENPEVTFECSTLAWSIISLSPLWRGNVTALRLVHGNRLTTVPKDYDIDRVIACEPTMNMYIQKGIGAKIRSRLKTVGIDLDDQTINQRLAKKGSIDGSLATVDLSAASDSISLAICRLLLPEQWYDLLVTTRSDCGVLPDGTLLEYAKISSMGNGYTFELESMLFWAITQACEDFLSDSDGLPNHRCSVYGDDIICRTCTVSLLRETLELCGFDMNVNKTFVSGPFRESCGKHYFRGIDVSPVFIKDSISSPSELIHLVNELRRWNRRPFGEDDPRYVDVLSEMVSFLPDFWQIPRIPDGFGDGALFGTLAEVRPSFQRGVYRARVIVKLEARISINRQSGFPMFQKDDYDFSVQTGFGSYLESLSSLEHRESNQTGAQRDIVRPGAYFQTCKTVRLYEWNDLALS